MFSRRELIAAGLAGGLTTLPDEAPAAPAEAQESTYAGQMRIAGAITEVERAIEAATAYDQPTFGVVSKVRTYMEQFLRANSKFPDFFDVGSGVFLELYDWHIRHRQQLAVTRLTDGRYGLQFMFSTMILRPEQDPNYLGYPYDRA